VINLSAEIQTASGRRAIFTFTESAKGPSTLKMSYPEGKATPEERRELCDIVNQRILEAKGAPKDG
jgi:hypothetical protein